MAAKGPRAFSLQFRDGGGVVILRQRNENGPVGRTTKQEPHNLCQAVRFKSQYDLRIAGYATFRLLIAARAIKPPPISAIVIGSGTTTLNSPENVLEMLPPGAVTVARICEGVWPLI